MSIRHCINIAIALLFATTLHPNARAQRIMERLDRGVVAMALEDGRVYVGWRLLGTDAPGTAFNLYRKTGGAAPVKLNAEPLVQSTNFIDEDADLSQVNEWVVRAIVKGREAMPTRGFKLEADPAILPYLSVPMQLPKGGYEPNDASVADLDGDSQYEIVIHMAARTHDNSHEGPTDPPILQAYEMDGTKLWEINLGKNIRDGAHYTQFMVYDLDSDGRAEIACKTADGTVDGQGVVIGDPSANYVNRKGRIIAGPEFLTVFDGMTGAALATTDYDPPRYEGSLTPSESQLKSVWGDGYGNRCDRFLAAVAYLDGVRPSLLMCRGYYTRTVVAAWDWRDGKLTKRWVFDSNTPGNEAYAGQGDHSVTVGDVDGDGKDELVYGSMCLDDDGTGVYSVGLGHGDALHLSDIDPGRPGLEVFNIHEHCRHDKGVELRDAQTGEILWSKPCPDVPRGVTMDLDPRHPGYECWALGKGLHGLWNCKGETISEQSPSSCNFAVWWDADPLREILDKNRISKWNWENSTETRLVTANDCVSINWTKANPCLCADILGDWREEVIWRTADGSELRIYTTTIPAGRRQYTLMHDPQYRLSVAWQNVGYNQPTQPGFYMGDGMADPPTPNITTPGGK